MPGGPAFPGGGAASVGAGGTGGTGVEVAAVSLPGLAPVRRLTHIEYDNTVADLLGDKDRPGHRVQRGRGTGWLHEQRNSAERQPGAG